MIFKCFESILANAWLVQCKRILMWFYHTWFEKQGQTVHTSAIDRKKMQKDRQKEKQKKIEKRLTGRQRARKGGKGNTKERNPL